MRRACLASSLTVALFALAAGPVLAQGRPSESGNPPGPSSPGSNAGSRGSGGGGGGGGGSSAGSSGGGSASTPSGGGFVGGGGERAVPRAGAPERRTPTAVGRGSSSPGGGGSSRKDPDSIGPIREVPEYGRPRGNRPVVGSAVARSEMPFTRPEWFRTYRTAFPYGVYYPGYWGANYFYYDPFFWGDPYYSGYPYGGYGGYYGGYGRGYYTYGDYGRLRLKVKPREAQVYVDGYFSGVVDQFDGVFQRLALKAGGHRIEIRAEGYEPLTFEVMITPHETVTYAGALKPR